jgi:hypothetical protein
VPQIAPVTVFKFRLGSYKNFVSTALATFAGCWRAVRDLVPSPIGFASGLRDEYLDVMGTVFAACSK